MGIYHWGNTNVVGKQVESRLGTGLYIHVANRYKALLEREMDLDRHILTLCRVAKGGCRKAAEALAKHGIRQYTQEEIDAINASLATEGGDHGKERQAAAV